MGKSIAVVPPAAEFDAVHPRDGKCLGDGTDAVPTEALGCPIHLRMTIGVNWKTRGEPEDITIHQLLRGNAADTNDYAGLKLRRYPRIERKPMELIVCTKKQPETICMISPKYGSSKISSTNIYSTRPRFEGQIPATNDDGNQQPTHRFLWAKINGAPKQGDLQVASSVVSFNTMEMVEEDNNMKRGDDAEANLSSYKSEEAFSSVGPQIVVRKGVKAAALLHISTRPFAEEFTLDIKISPGIDPCLVISLAAHIMDRMHVLRREGQNANTLSCLCFCCYSFTLGC